MSLVACGGALALSGSADAVARKLLQVQVRFPAAEPLPARSVHIPVPAFSHAPTGGYHFAISSHAVWVAGGADQQGSAAVVRVDPLKNVPSASLAAVDSVASDGHTVWASSYYASTVVQLDESTGAVLRSVSLPANSNPSGVTVSDGAAWVAEHHGAVVRIDPSGQITARVAVSRHPYGPQDPGFGFGQVWVLSGPGVFAISPHTARAGAAILPPQSVAPTGAWAFGKLAWVSGENTAGTVASIDPATHQFVAAYNVAGPNAAWLVGQLVVDGGTVWFTVGQGSGGTPGPGFLIHMRTDGKVLARYRLGSGFAPGGTAIAFGSVWLADGNGSNGIWRIPLHR